MSAKAQDWAWRIKGLSAYEKLVLMLLCYYTGEVSNECRTSKEHIAEVVGCSKRKVDMCIAVLVEQELIRVIHRNSDGLDLKNAYRVLGPKP
jgi:hypothetical protein